jgi:hypothetical protein
MPTSAWDNASDALKKNAAVLPAGQERKIRDIVGEKLWEPLQRTTRHRLGKHVRANPDYYGLEFVRKAGTIAVYKKSGI